MQYRGLVICHIANWKRKSCLKITIVHSVEKLVEIYYNGWDPPIPPDVFFEGFVDSHGWYAVETIDDAKYTECNFEYHPIRQLNDTLQSLAESS